MPEVKTGHWTDMFVTCPLLTYSLKEAIKKKLYHVNSLLKLLNYFWIYVEKNNEPLPQFM